MNDRDLFGVLQIIGSLKEIECRKRIQKMVCLGKYNSKVGYPFSFSYVKYLYGPYSFELKELLDKLRFLGLINEEIDHGRYMYSLTEDGQIFLHKIGKKVGKSEKEKLNLLTSHYPNDFPLQKLVNESKKVFS